MNDRTWLPEDFGTPEESIEAAKAGRAWEACMTFNGSWGYFPTAPASDWHSSREVIRMLRTVTAEGGNLLLNIGPAPDGSVPPLASDRLLPVGRWLARYGEAVYGEMDRVPGRLEEMNHGDWTLKGKTAYYWTGRWVGSRIVIGGLKTRVKSISIPGRREPVSFEQTRDRLVMSGLSETTPDDIAGYAVVKIEFVERPRQELGEGYIILRPRKGKR